MKKPEERYIGWLKLYDRRNLLEVGLKNAVLGEMKQAGFPVPPAFALTADAFEEILEYNNMKDRFYRVLSGLDPGQAEAVDQASKDIQKMIDNAGMPSELESLILQRYDLFSRLHAEETEMPMSVRPSPVIQGTADLAPPRALESFPWVKRGDVISSVLKCSMSLFNPRALQAFLKSGISPQKVSMSVCIQQFVDIRSAGSMFVLHREDRDGSKICIEGNWGFGVRPLPGDDEVDHWLLDMGAQEIIDSKIRQKKTKHIVDQKTGVFLQKDVEPGRQKMPCLGHDEILAIAELGRAIDLHFGKVEEIEWAVAAGSAFPENICILQCCPGKL